MASTESDSTERRTRFSHCHNAVFLYEKDDQRTIKKFLPFDIISQTKIYEGLCYENLRYRFLVRVASWSVVPTISLPTDVQNAVQKQEQPNCVQVLEFEYCNGGNLREYTKAYSPRQRILPLHLQKVIFVTSVLGLQYIHKSHYIHSDIKPDNIYIRILNAIPSNYTIEAAIGDFGSMRQLGNGDTSVTAVEGTSFLSRFSFFTLVFSYL